MPVNNRIVTFYDSGVPPDATETKRRLLDAALAEFAALGLAGARVDRIADAARANKRLIYLHFGNKAELFDLVVARALAQLSADVPFDGDDLPRYAGALFDYLLDNPQILRLTTWAQLERPDATAAETDAYRPKVEAIAGAQRAGMVIGTAEPADILSIVLALATAWANASPALRSLATHPAWSQAHIQAHRTAMIAAVRAAVTASITGS